jgi:hypothetical protein
MSATEADILAQSAQILEKAANDRNRATAIANAFAEYKAMVADLTQKLKEALDAEIGEPNEGDPIQAAYDNLKVAIDSLDASAVSDAALLNTEPTAPVPPAPPTEPAPVPTPVPGALPVISGFSPASADPDGGTAVQITGSGFTGVTAVTFGGVAAPTVAPSHDGALEAVAPPGSGTVDLVVSTAAGDSEPVQFSYAGESDGMVDENPPKQ